MGRLKNALFLQINIIIKGTKTICSLSPWSLEIPDIKNIYKIVKATNLIKPSFFFHFVTTIIDVKIPKKVKRIFAILEKAFNKKWSFSKYFLFFKFSQPKTLALPFVELINKLEK